MMQDEIYNKFHISILFYCKLSLGVLQEGVFQKRRLNKQISMND